MPKKIKKPARLIEFGNDKDSLDYCFFLYCCWSYAGNNSKCVYKSSVMGS